MNDVISTEFAQLSSTCLAYVGPGSGVTLLWSLLAVLAGIFFMFFGLFFWPLRVLLRKRRNKKANSEGGTPPNPNDEASKVTGDDKQTLPSV